MTLFFFSFFTYIIVFKNSLNPTHVIELDMFIKG